MAQEALPVPSGGLLADVTMTADSDPIPGASRAAPLPLDLGGHRADDPSLTAADPTRSSCAAEGNQPKAESTPGPCTLPACPTA